MSEPSAPISPSEIRATHPYAYRSGQWANFKGTVNVGDHGPCYIVEFEDGASDMWPVGDSTARYEFR